ncbi:hypothetical protein [uncultured Paraglaciecola sp.]|uniref:F0F1 ATP synthase subunit B family protein n=1 Tax=uncultured Paraglaciecola sp. TaxID=1765024 RepID=UPI0030DB4F44|tara:strand:- start:140088 stop:140930 length:843 start_codon:yes stop_codon:yes gene_type:complete
MTIDWFTVAAQTLNFLLLVWLLKRYLYGPILKAIDARENQVTKVLREADTLKIEAEAQLSQLQQKISAIDSKRNTLLQEATKSAHDQSEQILLQAHKNADEISNSRLLALEKELEHYQDDIALKTLQEIYEIAHKVLADLADVELELKMFECFCKHLKNMSPDESNNLNKTVIAGNNELVLYSAFELSQDQIQQIDAILHKVMAKTLSVTNTWRLKQEVKTSLICGLELRSDTWVIAWNHQDYLRVLKTHVNKLLIEQREALHNRAAQLPHQPNTNIVSA